MFGQTQQVNSDLSGLVGGQLPSGAGKALQLDAFGNLQTTGGGGGGGGAITAADGAIVTMGAKADAAITNPALSATEIALLKGLITLLAAPITEINSTAILADTADIEMNTANIPVLGQALSVASTPVVIASDQSAIPTRRGSLEVSASSGANAALLNQEVSNYSFISLHLTQIATNATLTFQASNDNFATQIENVNFARVSSTSSIAATATTTGIYVASANFRYFRVLQSGATASTTNITAEFLTYPANPLQINAVQGGTWTVQPGNTANTTPWLVSGTVTTTPPANASTNVAQIGGAAIAEGQTTMAGSIPVVIASNQSNVPTTIATALPTGSNLIGVIEQGDGTNISNVLKSDMTAAGQNAEIIAPTYFSSGVLTLNAGSPNTIWYDLGNYPWISAEILTNASAATLTFQTSGDASQTNIRNTPLYDSQGITSAGFSSTNGAVASVSGPRTGRYFRISSNVSGGNTITLQLTFYTAATVPPAQGVSAAQNGTWTVQPGNTPNTSAWLVKQQGVSTFSISAGTMANTVVKASAGTFYGVFASSTGAGGGLIYDNATTNSGTPVGSAPTAIGFDQGVPAAGVACVNGITVAGSATNPALTVFFL